jgi:pyruvate/2-oxoglutarate/acetoin dehydrogenase E1 component
LTLAMDQLVNQAAKLHFMTGGEACVPLVVRTMVGAGRGTGPQHGQSLESLLCHVPGLKVVAPSTSRDAYGLLKTAIRDNNPVVVFESLALWGAKGTISETEQPIPLGQADVRTTGTDVTLVSFGGAMARALEATRLLAMEGISAELIDLRSLQPLDVDAIRLSVEKTGRLVVAHDAVRFLGLGAEISASIAEQCHGSLKAPIARIAAPFSPVPFAPALENEYFPRARVIADAARKLVQP